MDYSEGVRALRGVELEKCARELFEDKRSLCDTVNGLLKTSNVGDCELIADILSFAPMDGAEDPDIYARRRRTETSGRRYFSMFLDICAASKTPLGVYVFAPIATAYAKTGSELAGWSAAADEFLLNLAAKNFNAAAEYLDRYDGGYKKYGILIRTNKPEAIRRLLDKAIFGKNINKSAVRDALMNYPEIADSLFDFYASADAKGRLAAVRLLKAIKNDGRVRDFLTSTAASDKAKTVRAAARLSPGGGKRVAADKYFENLLASGATVEYSALKKLIVGDKTSKAKSGYAKVAERLFFYVERQGGKRVLLFDNGKFTDTSDETARLKSGDRIGVLHPLDLDDSQRELFNVEIDQPFPQVARPVYSPTAGELYSSERLCGTVVTVSYFLAAMKREGFVFADKKGGGKDIAVIICGDYAAAVECDISRANDTVGCKRITYYGADSVVRLGRNIYLSSARPLEIFSLPQKAYSELTYAVYKLFKE